MKHCLTCGTQYGEELQFCPADGTPLVDVQTAETGDPLLGKVLEKKYRIERRLGEGAFGVVYQATHIHIESTVALKVLNKDLVSNSQAVERFRREARAAGRIQHPNAMSVMDFGVTEGNLVYIVMEYLEGITLSQRIRKTGRIPVEEALRVMRDVCGAVDAAHRKGVIHRDLKPDNIMLQQAGGRETVKVLDFGIAQLKSVSGTSLELTQQGTVIGTPFYMSPEQCTGKELDPRSDIYSLGVILFEMLTGQVPFKADSAMGVIIKHTTEQPPRLRQIAPDIPPPFEVVTLRALAKSPEERQPSAADLSRELEQALAKSRQRPAPVPPADDPYRTVIKGDTRLVGGPAGVETDLLAGQVTSPMLSESEATAKTELVSAIPADALGRTLETNEASGATEFISGVAPLPAPAPQVASRYETNIMSGGSSAPSSDVAIPRSRVAQAGYTERIGEVRRASRTSLYVSLAAVVVVAAAVFAGYRMMVARTTVIAPAGGSGNAGPTIPAGMILIPAGTFLMGADEGDHVGDDEKPAHSVSVAAFYLGKYEVTNKEYQEFVIAKPYAPPQSWKGTNFPPGQENVPVTDVTLPDAVAYCEWLSEKTGFDFRLPSEEEWEYAAKGTDQRIFPWGNEFDPTYTNSLERTQGSGFSKPLPLDVTKYSETRSPFGTVNQAGNVAEWTASDARLYPGSHARPIVGEFKVYRGGNFLVDKYALRTTSRYWNSPDTSQPWLGFRLAMDVPQEK